MNVYEIIKKKRDGLELSGEEINFLVSGFVKGRIPDYQMSAFLMAVYYRSMNIRECCDPDQGHGTIRGNRRFIQNRRF